jgi:flagellar basal-body rod protein FlgB
MDLASATIPFGQYLSYLTRRQEVIASNIANADTPGYRARDVNPPGPASSFYAALSQASDVLPVAEVDGLISRSDGNNVSIDREARLLAETALKFNVATQLLRGQIKNLRSAIEEGRTT